MIACENTIGGSQELHNEVMRHVPNEYAEAVEGIAGFPNAAVDRIVPELQAWAWTCWSSLSSSG